MTEWMQAETRLRGNDEPSRLHLLFIKNVGLNEGVIHECPIGKSDRELLEMTTLEGCDYQEEPCKERKKDFAKADYIGLKTSSVG